LDQELAEEAQREGTSAEEHATLLVVLTMALLKEQNPTPFQEAVRSFLARRALDPDRIASAFEEMARLCLQVPQGSRPSLSSEETVRDATAQRDSALLKQWRNAIVHGVEVSPKDIPSNIPLSEAIQPAGWLQRPAEAGTEIVLDQQDPDDTKPAHKPIRERPLGTRNVRPEVDAENAASIALLQSWLEEDATDDPGEIRKAQEELDEFKRGINEERERARARRIYP
jgi:hypothetical protein